MGNQNTIDKGMKQYIKQEFERVKEDKERQYLKVSEVLKLQHPENNPFNFTHLGILFLVDNNKGGTITLNQLLHFAQFCARNLKNVQTYEFQQQLQGLATQLLWDHMCKSHIDSVTEWLIKLLVSNDTIITYQGHQFIKLESVQVIYEICNIKVMSNIDIQQFVDLLQQAGEESGLMSLDQEELDEYVPLEICQEFIQNFLNGFKTLMIEIGFADKLNLQQ